ncbi:MAG: hypothetical protein ABS86_04395 [Sphingobium sp. SCN 64-10]|nr:MAG: hypothetical protein ABS86_04395 [Sphingobium sp. SCN 64-10]
MAYPPYAGDVIAGMRRANVGPQAVGPILKSKADKADIHSAFETCSTGSNLLRRAEADETENYTYAIAL